MSWPSGCPPNRQRLQSILDLKRSRFIVGPTTFRSHHIPRSWITFYLTFWLGCFLTAPWSRELNTGAPQSPTLLLHRRRGGQLQLEVLAVEHTSCALGGRMQKPRLLVTMAMRELREDRQLVGDDDKNTAVFRKASTSPPHVLLAPALNEMQTRWHQSCVSEHHLTRGAAVSHWLRSRPSV